MKFLFENLSEEKYPNGTHESKVFRIESGKVLFIISWLYQFCGVVTL